MAKIIKVPAKLMWTLNYKPVKISLPKLDVPKSQFRLKDPFKKR